MISQRSAPMRRLHAVLALSLVALFACAAPVGVERIDPAEVHRELTANVLTRGVPSAFSRQVLTREGLSESYRRDPEETLAVLHGDLAASGDEDRLFALAERESQSRPRGQRVPAVGVGGRPHSR